MRKFYIYALAAALLTLAGCKREAAPGVSGEIRINASIGAMTKVSYDGNTTSFTAGDRIAVYAWTGDATTVPSMRVVNGEVNTFDGTAWTPANQMEWYDLKSAHYFLGITPVAAVTDFTADPYTLDPADYTGSDLLIATSLDGITPSANPVDLTFTHAMAKLNVNLKFRSQWDATPTVTSVTVTAKTTATVNYLTKAVTATGDASEVDIPEAATAATGYALSFSGLQVPQDGVTTVTVTIDGKTYVYESSTDIPLASGQYTTLGLIVGNDKIEFDGIAVADWDEEITLPGAEAEVKPAGSMYELTGWLYYYASFIIEGKFGDVYYTYEQGMGSSYSPDNIVSAFFTPIDNNTAPVLCELDKENHYVRFRPDKTDQNKKWLDFQSFTGVKREDVAGILSLTDRFGKTGTFGVNMSWFNTNELDYSLDVSLDNDQSLIKGANAYYTYNLTDQLLELGLDDDFLMGCRYSITETTEPLTGQDAGYEALELHWKGSNREVDLVFNKPGNALRVGDKYRVRGTIRVKVNPGTDPTFQPTQVLLTYCVTVNIVD